MRKKEKSSDIESKTACLKHPGLQPVVEEPVLLLDVELVVVAAVLRDAQELADVDERLSVLFPGGRTEERKKERRTSENKINLKIL